MAERVVEREFRSQLRRAHIGEDEAVIFAHAIGALAEILLDAAGIGLGRRLEHGAVDIEEPAVIAAANAARRGNAEFERRAAMNAMAVQEAEPAALVPEQHQIFAEETH